MINDKYLLETFKFKSNEIGNKEQVIKGDKYRLTILTDRFFRFEYSETGVFYNVPTETIINRDLGEYPYSLEENNNILTIKTKYFTVNYTKNEPFLPTTLNITSNDGVINYKFGDKPKDNLKGTVRTLDEAKMAIKLNDGLFSLDGYTIIDDSKTIVFNHEQFFARKNLETTDIYFFGYQNDFKAGLKDFYQASGNTPLVPRYALGNWYSKYFNFTDKEVIEIAEQFKESNIPLSVFVLDMHWHITDDAITNGSSWTGYTFDTKNYKNPEKTLHQLKKMGIRTALNMHPSDGIHPHEEGYNEFKKLMGSKENEVIKFDVTDPKFLNGYFNILHHGLEKKGVDFFWIDWQQGTKSGIKNLDPLFALNHLHYLDSTKNNKKGLILSRYSGLGGQRYPLGFSGDTVSNYEILDFLPYFTATSANVGFGIWSHDIGGHFFGLSDEELYLRWIQFGVFSPVLRMHSANSIYYKREPWLFDEEREDIISDFLRLRHKLIPYIYTFYYQNSLGNVPLCYPLYYEYPNEKNAYEYKNEYFFGSELIIAPVTEKMDAELNHAKTEAFIAETNYYDFFRGTKYAPGKHTIYSTQREMPILAKEGAIIPLAVLSKVNQIDNPKELDIHIFLGSDNEFNLYEDDSLTTTSSSVNTKIKTKYSKKQLKIDFEVTGDLALIPEIRVYNLHIRNINNKMNVDCMGLISEQYDHEKKTLIIRLMHEVHEKTSVTITGKELINDEYSYQDEITRFLQKTNVEIRIKELIGYKYNGGNPHVTGLLSLPKEDFVKELKKQKIDKKLFDAIISFVR